MRTYFALTSALLLFPLASAKADDAVAIVAKIQRADYEGDRVALKKLHDDLAPLQGQGENGARICYWQGFALWRRALNGFNESADPKELEADLTQALADFRSALARDASFIDAKGGEGSCLANLAFLDRRNQTRARELIEQSYAVLNDALAREPDNPRVLWVHGANQWYGRPDRGGGQDKALATYEAGLASARKQRARAQDPLEPAWGEPEILMNLAFAKFHGANPDIDAAERYAQEALALVPYWHYVRDILLPQIRKAKANTP